MPEPKGGEPNQKGRVTELPVGSVGNGDGGGSREHGAEPFRLQKQKRKKSLILQRRGECPLAPTPITKKEKVCLTRSPVDKAYQYSVEKAFGVAEGS